MDIATSANFVTTHESSMESDVRLSHLRWPMREDA